MITDHCSLPFSRWLAYLAYRLLFCLILIEVEEGLGEGGVVGAGVDWLAERVFQNLGDLFDKDEGHRLPHLGGQIIQIFLVSLRKDDGVQPGAVGGKHFLLDPAHGEHAAAQRDLAGHAHVGAHRAVRQ